LCSAQDTNLHPVLNTLKNANNQLPFCGSDSEICASNEHSLPTYSSTTSKSIKVAGAQVQVSSAPNYDRRLLESCVQYSNHIQNFKFFSVAYRIVAYDAKNVSEEWHSKYEIVGNAHTECLQKFAKIKTFF
jgi:hypothetical protein